MASTATAELTQLTKFPLNSKPLQVSLLDRSSFRMTCADGVVLQIFGRNPMSKPPRKKKAPPTPTKLSLNDKAILIGFLLLLLGLPAVFLHIHSINQQSASVSKTVEKWKTTYHISDEQAADIKKIELDFHGSGSPFSIKPARTHEEKHRHHEEISRLMSPEDGARFMKAMEKSEGKH